MPRNGAGAYSLPTGNPVVTGTAISSTVQNTTMTDIGTALTQSLAKDGQTTPSANLPMGSFRHTGVGNGVARTDYPSIGQVQDSSFMWCGTATGTANALLLVPTPIVPAIVAGQRFAFKSGASPNSGATTASISTLPTIAVQVNGAACVGGEILADKWYEILVDASLTSCQLNKIGRATLTELGISAFAQTFLDDADASTVLSTLGFSTFAKTIIDDADAAAMRTTLGIVAGALIGAQVFTSSGTYTPTSGTQSVVAEVQGGGGGGGWAFATTAGQFSMGTGGHAGTYGKSRITSGFSGVTVTVGAAGASGPGTGVSGAPGGTSSFGSFVTAPGGLSGLSVAAGTSAKFSFPVANTTPASGGNILNEVGGCGGVGMAFGTGLPALSGYGGASKFGGGAVGVISGVGLNAINKGSGGSGATNNDAQAAAIGGNGAPGIVIVWEYA